MRDCVGALFVCLLLAAVGCGTTRMSDTSRTGTEQLLLSTAVDRAINNIDFKPLVGKDVYLDTQYLGGVVDKDYIVSSLRQHMLAHGCRLQENRDDATYVAEARAGAVGTNRHDVMLGVPAINVPTAGLLPGVPSAIPEIPFAKTTNQKGIAKIAVFAYNRETNQPVWQSGVFPVVSDAKDTWVLGAGPFQRGSIYEGTRFAGNRMIFSRAKKGSPSPRPTIPVTAEAIFEERPVIAQQTGDKLSQAPRALSEVEQAHALQPADEATEQPDQQQPTGQEAPTAAPAMLPNGRIVRLPPTEQVDPLPYSSQGDSSQRGGEQQRESAVEAEAADGEQPHGPPADSEFSIFRPGTWFGSPNVQGEAHVTDGAL